MLNALPEIYVIAHNIRSLYNVGALFRLCDGAGVAKLYLTGITGAPFESVKFDRQRRQIAKTALAGLASVPWEYREDAHALIEELKNQHVVIVALEQTGRSISYLDAPFTFPLCLILGNEVEGVDDALLDLADLAVYLPMLGQGKSLNVISAASVGLYHLRTPTSKKA